MRLRWFCDKCNSETPVAVESEVQLRDDGIYILSCNNDHEIIIFLLQPKFITLLDMGVFALLDGYPREAVTNFAAALERFYEFSIRVILAHKGMNENVINNTWKLTSKQSERQYGAFCIIYALEFNKAPSDLRKWVEFRNKVVHGGYIPSFEEVINHGSVMYDFIKTLSKELKSNYFDSIYKPVHQKHKEFWDKDDNRYGVVIRNGIPKYKYDNIMYHSICNTIDFNGDVSKWDIPFKDLVENVRTSDSCVRLKFVR